MSNCEFDYSLTDCPPIAQMCPAGASGPCGFIKPLMHPPPSNHPCGPGMISADRRSVGPCLDWLGGRAPLDHVVRLTRVRPISIHCVLHLQGKASGRRREVPPPPQRGCLLNMAAAVIPKSLLHIGRQTWRPCHHTDGTTRRRSALLTSLRARADVALGYAPPLLS